MPESPVQPEIPAGAPPSSAPWVSTQHEMERRARPLHTRLFRLRMKTGQVRVASVTYFQSSVASQTDSRVETLYRVQLSWLAEIDPRDGKAQRFAERTSTGRPANALQFRVLEMNAPDGHRVSAARLGPKGEIHAEPTNMGVMSLLRALLVEWVVDKHAEATVLTGSLKQAEVQTPAQLEVRDAFFARSGFTIKPTSDGGGTFYAASLGKLRSAWNAEKFTELTPALQVDALCAQMEQPLLRQQIAALQESLKGIGKEKRAAETLQRLWLAITVLAVVFAIVFGIQPRLH